MRKRFTEQTIIFISIRKWFVLASCIGAIDGLATTIFIGALNWSTGLTSHYAYYFLLVPVAATCRKKIFFDPGRNGQRN